MSVHRAALLLFFNVVILSEAKLQRSAERFRVQARLSISDYCGLYTVRLLNRDFALGST